MSERHYISDIARAGAWAIVDRERQKAPDYEGQELRELEHVVALCPEGLDACELLDALVLFHAETSMREELRRLRCSVAAYKQAAAARRKEARKR